jgi:hypothetical protein
MADNLVNVRCPQCRTKRDVHYIVDVGNGTGEPADGDITVCVMCGCVAVYSDHALRVMTITQRAALRLSEQQSINRIVAIVRRLDNV